MKLLLRIFVFVIGLMLMGCSSGSESYETTLETEKTSRFTPRANIPELYLDNPLMCAQNDLIDNGSELDVVNGITGSDLHLWILKETAKELSYSDFKQFISHNSAANTLADNIWIWFEDDSGLILTRDIDLIFYFATPYGFPNQTMCGYAIKTDKEEYDYTQIINTTVKGYPQGQYKIGVDIPAGEYVLYPHQYNGNGYYCISSDANGKNIVDNDFFTGHSIITVYDGDYLELSGCVSYDIHMTPRRSPSPSGYIKSGVYIGGVDIPAGEYRLTSNEGKNGYYCIYSDSRKNNILSNDNFNGSRYINISNGDYLLLANSNIFVGEDFSPNSLEGEYYIGQDMSPGVYTIIPTNLYPGIYVMSTTNFMFRSSPNKVIVELKDGDYLLTDNCVCIPIGEPDYQTCQKPYTLKNGEWLVGHHLPAGTYTISVIGSYRLSPNGFYSVRDSVGSTAPDSISFTEDFEITLIDGQVLYLENAQLTVN